MAVQRRWTLAGDDSLNAVQEPASIPKPPWRVIQQPSDIRDQLSLVPSPHCKQILVLDRQKGQKVCNIVVAFF